MQRYIILCYAVCATPLLSAGNVSPDEGIASTQGLSNWLDDDIVLLDQEGSIAIASDISGSDEEEEVGYESEELHWVL